MGYKGTNEEEVKKLERRFRKIYKQAQGEVQEKLDKYLTSFASKDRIQYEKVLNGEMDMNAYLAWKNQQIMVGKRWEKLRDELAERYTKANSDALEALGERLPQIFADSVNFTTYGIEKFSGIDTNFTLWDASTVQRLVSVEPTLLPKPKVKIDKDKKWNQKKITSAITQGILQGESIPHLSKRLRTVTDMNYKAAVRNARTAVTSAENGGRNRAYYRAQGQGVQLQQQWLATLDMRTRHEHRELDGQIRDIGKPFEIDGVKLDYPADPQAPPRLVYNCRCTTIAVVNGHAVDLDARDKSVIGDYNEWKGTKPEPPKPVSNEPIPLDKVMDPNYKSVLTGLKKTGIEYVPVERYEGHRTSDEIAKELAGGDLTKGSCASVGLCYIGQKLGFDVHDFRDGKSREFFASYPHLNTLIAADGIKVLRASGASALTVGNRLVKQCEEGKEYYLCVGCHASIIRKRNGKLQYLELQSETQSGWTDFDGNPKYTLNWRFRATSTSQRFFEDYSFMIDIDDSDFNNDAFRSILGYMNTEKGKERKGARGSRK